MTKHNTTPSFMVNQIRRTLYLKYNLLLWGAFIVSVFPFPKKIELGKNLVTNF